VLQEAGPQFYPLVMDVTDAGAVAAVMQEAVAARGPIAICVANAGIAEGRSLLKTEPEFWRQIMATNLDGAYLTIREALRSMSQLDWGRVIAVSSIAGTKGLKGAPAYAASKFGVNGLIKALAQDYAGKGLTFNALCPAYVDTEIITRNVASIKARAGVSAEVARDMMVGLNPHGRLIAPSEVAAAALWLCGPGSDSVNGQLVEIAGGVM
jgi:NAD(P)-dependent dehydrogenase (short-subunit alcohol dehydrogenase family)